VVVVSFGPDVVVVSFGLDVVVVPVGVDVVVVAVGVDVVVVAVGFDVVVVALTHSQFSSNTWPVGHDVRHAPLQRSKPELHLKPHVPPVQTGTALSSVVEQTVQLTPQWVTSLATQLPPQHTSFPLQSPGEVHVVPGFAVVVVAVGFAVVVVALGLDVVVVALGLDVVVVTPTHVVQVAS
jgi:hypothetical protein